MVCIGVGCISLLGNILFVLFFFFQAEDGIRYLVRSRGLGDVYKRQVYVLMLIFWPPTSTDSAGSS